MLKCIKYAKFDQNIPRGPRVMKNIDNNAKTWTLLKIVLFCMAWGAVSLWLLLLRSFEFVFVSNFCFLFFVRFFFLFFISRNAVMCSLIDQ